MGLGRFRALGAAVLTAGLILSSSPAASAEPTADPGKSSVVAPCKKGGWMALAPEDDAAVPFRNQGECIQYLAQGGSAVATTGTPVAPGQSKGCKAAKQKAEKDASAGQQAEPKAKPCKPRKAKVRSSQEN
jgi:hypothetical protein